MSIDAAENEPSSYRETYKTTSQQRVSSTDSSSVNLNQMQSSNLSRVKVVPNEHQMKHSEKSSYRFYKKISSVSTSNLSISKQFNSSITAKKPISASSSNDLLYDENFEKHKKSLKIESRSPTYKKRTATTINYIALNSFSNFKCKAIKSFKSTQSNHLSFEQNDTIVLLDNSKKEYWHGYLDGEPSKSGYFPSSYVNLYL
jgi:phosphorylcholine metabolism protein LicD